MTTSPKLSLRLLLFPVPLAYAFILTAISVVAAIATGLQVNTWAYVSLSHLSALPRESITNAGPITAAATCYLAGNLFDKRSPASSGATPRRDNRLLTTVTATLAGSAVLGHAVGTIIILVQHAPRATAGTINWLELAFGPLQLLPLVLLGIVFACGGTRWWLPLLSLVTSLFWILILPILAGAFLPMYPYSVGHEFFYPATPAYRHEDFFVGRLLLIFVFWLLVSVTLAILARMVVRRQGTLPVRISYLGPVLLATMGVTAWISLDEGRLYSTFPESYAVCETQGEWTYCVMPEEADLLEGFSGEASYVLSRSKNLGNAPVTLISSGLSVSQWEAPTSDREIIVAAVSDVRGVENVKNDVAGALSGLFACAIGGSHDGATIAALGLTHWLTGAPQQIGTNPFAIWIDDLNDSEREEWLIENEVQISTCTIEYED